ncbi:hypothetical protein [Allorhodopirellula solitaria]|uniref:Uncharacterized protein n=1 Tax=Allorhodopirellula solitaria TaxID=2527987 RepID=A0A5C5X202_9BACT|nr:hypothetical protein [Allorhodopirellula solitaria]TWT56195.1 hypothetical protein CA85_43770 [Allorhodopirellula solitaria]
MSGRRRSSVELGHDAFLDIVANLVGILIILVVILGTQTHHVTEMMRAESEVEDELDSTDSSSPVATRSQLDELGQMAMRAASAQRESMELEAKLRRYDAQVQQLDTARGKLLDLLGVAEAAWEDAQSKLDQSKVRGAKLQREIHEIEGELAELAGTKDRLANEKAPLVAVEHLPTPMAKTVFGDEIDLRLKAGRLSVVPVEILMKDIKEDVQRMTRKPGNAAATVGPMRDYIANYVIERTVERVSQNGRSGMAMTARLGAVAFEPLTESVGQPIGEVLRNRSFLDVELAGRDPNATTITVWVYPDSFGELRQLKEHLYQRGFATASRPLMEGQAIIFSSSGTRSKAQ